MEKLLYICLSDVKLYSIDYFTFLYGIYLMVTRGMATICHAVTFVTQTCHAVHVFNSSSSGETFNSFKKAEPSVQDRLVFGSDQMRQAFPKTIAPILHLIRDRLPLSLFLKDPRGVL
jgi:hypothetical protein